MSQAVDSATDPRVVALIPAAGSGERLGYVNDDRSRVAKALVPCAGRPLLAWSLIAFAQSMVESAVVAAPADDVDAVRDVVADHCPAGLAVEVVTGGFSRSESVMLALQAAMRVGEYDLAAVHDAARPLIDPQAIDACVRLVAGDDDLSGAMLAAPLADTVKEVGSDGRIVRTLDRSLLWAAQTPQVFKVSALRDALAGGPGALAGATDDASLVEARGGAVAVLDPGGVNLKVTTAADLALADQLLATRLRDRPVV